jgi:uncharacterized protein (TIGR02001 family)
MNLLKTSLLAAAASLALGGAALAQPAPTWSVNAAVTSDYVFRGLSQTGTYDPAVQGGLDLGLGPVYAGTWASNVKFGNGTDAEVDVYGGVRPAYAGFNFDLGVIGYLYPGAPSKAAAGFNTNYVELKGAVSHAVGPATVGAAVFWSPDYTFTAGNHDGVYYELNASVPVKQFSLSGAVGHQWIEGSATDYTTWNVGVSWNFLPHLSLDGRYWDTDHHGAFGDFGDSRVVATLKATYP